MSERCEHPVLEPKQHPDGPVVPACTTCGQFVVRGELHITMPLTPSTPRGEEPSGT